jgi:hypothetical protein
VKCKSKLIRKRGGLCFDRVRDCFFHVSRKNGNTVEGSISKDSVWLVTSPCSSNDVNSGRNVSRRCGDNVLNLGTSNGRDWGPAKDDLKHILCKFCFIFWRGRWADSNKESERPRLGND